MAALSDVNLLVALTWPNRAPHVPARRWFARRAPGMGHLLASRTGFRGGLDQARRA